MVNAVIFDLDGVIISTDRYHYKAWKSLADEYGIYFDEKINDRLRGVSRMSSLEIILEKYSGLVSAEEKTAMAEKKNEIYKKLLSELAPESVSDDVTDTLKMLKSRGYKLAIGSSSKNAKYILERIGLITAFDAISDGTNIHRSKPDPEVFIKAAKFLDVPTGYCAVVEDARDGIDAAKAAGMTAIAIGSACSYKAADFYVASLSELPSLECMTK